MRPFIGIDLGTTNSCVATLTKDDKPLIVENQQGQSTTPSVVSFRESDDGEARPVVGAPAARMAVTNPTNTVFGVKRLIGRQYDDPEVHSLAESLPYVVEPAANGDAWVEAAGALYSPAHISAIVLTELRELAAAHFGESVTDCVITVPAYFGGEQRRATVVAADMAGLTVRRLVNEPTAAALGYGAHRDGNKRFAICDLGGGTFDVSVVSVEAGVVEVISTHGNLFLGGDDFDREVLRRLAEDIRERHGTNVSTDATAIQRLRGAITEAKHTLSSAKRADVALPHLASLGDGHLDYEKTITRELLDEWTRPVVDRLESPCREAIARCGLRMTDIDAVILVGGMTRMPLVQSTLTRIFGRAPLKVVNPDEIVAIGAATQCAILEGRLREVILLDLTAQALALASPRGQFATVIPKNATIPTREQRVLVADLGDGPPVFDVFEGDAPTREGNRLIGRYQIDAGPDRGAEATFVVTLTVDVDGILRVEAREMGSQQPLSLRLLAGAGLRAIPTVSATR